MACKDKRKAWAACTCLCVFLVLSLWARAETVLCEGETFTCDSDGWQARKAPKPQLASGRECLSGASGPTDAVAERTIALTNAGPHRIWVRWMQSTAFRGPFVLSVRREGQELASRTFDLEADESVDNFDGRWGTIETELPSGRLTLRLSKYEQKNCSGWTRLIDCVLVTDDLALQPDWRTLGPQTYVRIVVGDIYTNRPVQIHWFVPFSGHFHFSKAGLGTGTGPQASDYLEAGDSAGWCNITKVLHPRLDVGARPIIDARYTYTEEAPRLKARFEFATAPEEAAIVKTLNVDYEPGTLYLALPTDLGSPENLDKFTVDLELAEKTGRLADSFEWPTLGRKPTRYPFFCAFAVSRLNFKPDRRVAAREWKTFDHFGFVNDRMAHAGGGTWRMKNNSQCDPDVEAMRAGATKAMENYLAAGVDLDRIVYCKIMDEPSAQKSSFAAGDAAFQREFVAWIKQIGKTPADLLVGSWDDVRPVAETDRDKLPGLHYYTQRFRTVALSRFMSVQRQVIEDVYGRPIPAIANFSDVATYMANCYARGSADYWLLLDAAKQNALWSECGGALASTSLCTDYNVDLMRSAARGHEVRLGHYWIDYGRKPWDVKCKAVGHAARNIKVLVDYFYGPTWGSYEGGPPWHSGAWYAHPEKWYANAELLLEFGAAEDLLVPATREPAEVAILYSASSDIWELNRNNAFGFDRMHIWLALTHAQVPVDFVAEDQVVEGDLDRYKVCYLVGPNLRSDVAPRVEEWVRAGGVLYATAGAAERDEFNRPLPALEALFPAVRQSAEVLDPHRTYGGALWALKPREIAAAGETALDVLSVKQAAAAKDGAEILATFSDGSPAVVRGRFGQGTVYAAGFLPGLAYVRPAIMARRELEASERAGEEIDDESRLILERSINPWEFPGAVRDIILAPVRLADIDPPIRCSVPLVDAGYMTCREGIVIPLANYTLRPIENLKLQIRIARPVARIESVHHGTLGAESVATNRLAVTLPLESTDFVKLYYRSE